MQKNANYQEINIRITPGAVDELIKLGAMATPALVIGDKVIVGFDPLAIDQALAEMHTQ